MNDIAVPTKNNKLVTESDNWKRVGLEFSLPEREMQPLHDILLNMNGTTDDLKRYVASVLNIDESSFSIGLIFWKGEVEMSVSIGHETLREFFARVNPGPDPTVAAVVNDVRYTPSSKPCDSCVAPYMP